MDIKELLPKDKYDEGNIEKLNALSDEEISPLIPDILEWLQDYNWPVAEPIRQVLLKRERLVVPCLPDILESDDAMWKIWIMELLIPHFTEDNKYFLKQYIEKLAGMKVENEDDEEVSKTAGRLLKLMFE